MKKNLLNFALFTFFLSSVSFQLTAQEKNFKKTVQVNGRIQYDYEFLKREKSTDWLNGNEFRRVYLSVSGKIAPKIKYKAQIDIASGEIGFRDMYIKYLGGKYGDFTVGSLAQPIGLELNTSSKYIPFIERAMLSSMQNYKWGSGFHYENFHLFNDKAGIQLAITGNGNNKEAFKDPDLEKGQNIALRFTGVPLYDVEKNALLHLGVNYANRPNNDFKFRPENHMGNKYSYLFPGADRNVYLGLELAANYHSFSLQTEYKTENAINDIHMDYKIDSYYIMGSYFLTGEHRPYKKGSFGRVKPLKDVFHQGYGALEVLLRYSNLTTSHDIVLVNPTQPDHINNITIGLNWYLTSHARFMYNYVITDDRDPVLGKLKGHLIRMQIDF